MPIILPLLFAIGLVGTADSIEANYDPVTAFQLINIEWDTHAEGWDKVVLIPQAAPVVTLPVSDAAEDNVYRGMGPGWPAVEQFLPLIASQFPADQVQNAACAVVSESGANPNAINQQGSSARGLFQVLASLWAPYFGWEYNDLYVPELNVYAAARIWEMDGWGAWSPRTRRNCGL